MESLVPVVESHKDIPKSVFESELSPNLRN